MTEITDHQGNANQNHDDVSPETCQMVIIKKTRSGIVGSYDTSIFNLHAIFNSGYTNLHFTNSAQEFPFLKVKFQREL